MLFQSLQFLIFFVPVFLANLLVTNHHRSLRLRKGLLIVASAIFYMSWSVPLFALLAASILVNFYASQRIARSRDQARYWVTLGVSVQLVILGVFKYANFGIDAATRLLSLVGLELPETVLHIVLPLGISFYTFQGIGYVIDVYREHYPPYESLLDFFLYISFFPQLVAGPIVRADFFLERLRQIDRPIDLGRINSGLLLFVVGVFKKAVLADNCAKIANFVFMQPEDLSALIVLLGLYAFAFQIYFDFSGYTDMARGLGRMLGIELPVNFNLPYLARGLREFWQRWHISLSTWLRDYLYISLGGSRVGRWLTMRNLLITMLLGGLWHGASYTFLIWGGIHGLALAVEHATVGKGERRVSSPVANFLLIVLTFHLVCLAWIFFRADSLPNALVFLGRLADFGSYGAFGDLGYFKPQNWLFGLIVPAVFVFGIERFFLSNEIGPEMRSPLGRALVFCGLFFLILLVSGGSSEFIYFQF
jgi:D-alanyl-lipoteichoic acid acyltransferase DltB (MBOAT superfamily)